MSDNDATLEANTEWDLWVALVKDVREWFGRIMAQRIARCPSHLHS
ncbi:MAG: hypothetical protein J2P36_12885 [Ktedonobacteraceae bacterium]|nr:hypothetical protein [Ktedonobacteraceae bacterium]